MLTLIAAVCAAGVAIAADEPAKPAPMTVKDMPVLKEMPDPLTMLDGTKVTTVEQWRKRRQEMIKIIEEYEYGHMPPAPGNVKGKDVGASKVVTLGGAGRGRRGPAPGAAPGAPAATPPAAGAAAAPATLQANYRQVHLTFGPQEKLGFDLGLFTPVETDSVKAPFPVLISLGFSSNETSAGQFSEALKRGYAVATIAYTQLGADATNYRSTAFFPAYPEYDWNDFSAWAWGISRAVDYLVTDPAIDKNKIMATGVSRNGQAALLAGALDERIAVTIPVGGGSALRFSGKNRGKGQGIDEVVVQETYWFGPRYPEFKGVTEKLPCDQHWLLALTAPRLFIMCNALADQYGDANAVAQTYLYAKPVYEFLKVPDNVGMSFREGMHGQQAPDIQAMFDFTDEKLLGKPAKRKFDMLPPGTTGIQKAPWPKD
jgi:hypothetical protein